jgi:primosomal protein N' (replication factor Y)
MYLAVSAADVGEVTEQLRGRKQKQIVSLLRERKAFGPDSAQGLQTSLQALGCSNEPLKRLAEKQIIKIAEKTILKSLPVIPKGMATTIEKIVLNEDQQKALAHFKAQVDSGRFSVTLLHGVTDSGKTELYIRAIEAVLQKGKTAIVLLPEIALTAQTVQRFSARFDRIAVMHSGLTASQRNAQWQKIRAGEADVVIGARSAVFAPLPGPGLVIVDEEHEPSYKQDTAPRYQRHAIAGDTVQLP